MNVSRKGYYTSNYLDKRKKRPEPAPQSENNSMSSIWAGPGDDLSPVSSTRSENPDHLDKAPTPANLNYLYKKNRQSVDYANYYSARKPRKQVVDDSVLSFNTEEDDSVFEQQKRAPSGYQGYYIDQKKRYEEAEEVKPKLFTHKTFMDVFDRDEDERFNPVDVVFDDPEKVREQENKQKLSKVLKTVQKKVGMNDYNSYDYYVQTELHKEKMAKLEEKRQAKLAKQEQKEAKKAKDKKRSFKLDFSRKKKGDEEEEQELFVKDVSDDSDDEELERLDDETSSQAVKKSWKKKWKSAKKALSDDYFESYNREIDTKKRIAEMNQEEEQQTVHVESGERYAGPNENFHPLWNYMLSWLVYSSTVGATAANANVNNAKDKVVELDRPATSSPKKKKKRMGGANFRNYKNALRNWNDPASKYLPGAKSIVESRALQPYDQDSQMSTMGSEYPDEIELSDDGNLSDEFVLGGGSLSLYRGNPPTSASAMKTGGLADGGPVKIVSNINELIKRVKIMKIIFAPIDVIAVSFPSLQTVVILVELVIFMWILYELSLLIDALCMAVKAVCAPMIAIGKFMNRIV